MERMWRKMNQGLSSTTSSVFKQTTGRSNSNNNSHSDSANQALRQSLIIDDGPVYANVPQYNRGWGYIDTSKCRKRRRKVKPRRNSSKEKNAKTKNSEKGKNSTKETISLRERAVAKLKILNFNINWDVHMKPCGSRANSNILTRRLCRNRSCDDNELYRSNSFKFERFRRDDVNDVAVNTLPKQINVCDDYSLPVDFVKKRPSSLEHCRDVRFADDFASPSIPQERFVQNPNLSLRNEHIREKRPLSTASTSGGPQVLLNYCEPKDSKKLKHKKSSSRKQYSSDSSLPNSTDDEVRDQEESKYDSSESIDDSFINFNEPEYANQERKSSIAQATLPINPSPYYYADLLQGNSNNKGTTSTQRSTASSIIFTTQPARSKRFTSFLDPPENYHNINNNNNYYKKRSTGLQKRHSITERDVNRCDTFSSTTSDDSNCSECQKRREIRINQLNICDSADEVPSPAPAPLSSALLDPCNYCIEFDENSIEMAPHRILGSAACICAAPDINDDGPEQFRSKSIFYVHQQGEDECADCSLNKIDSKLLLHDPELAHKHRIQVYETAFDSTVQPCDENRFDIEQRIRNAMLMEHHQFLLANEMAKQDNAKTINNIKTNCDYHDKIIETAKDLQNLHINLDANVACTSSSSTNNARYTHSPPSTAPLPIKFPSKHEQILHRHSIRSAPNLPLSNAIHRQAIHDTGDKTFINNSNAAPERLQQPVVKRSSSNRVASKKCSHGLALSSDRVLQLRHHKRRVPRTERNPKNFSSNDSITSSSASGSIESLRSSTSEGNRSTSSSESHRSASLSSHSSDSGAQLRYPLRAPVIIHANMNILSPISDKSLQEPPLDANDASSAATRNLQLFTNTDGTGTKLDAGSSTSDNQKAKRRYLQNRASLLLKDEIQGSDSGISLQSRDDSKSKNLALHNFNIQAKPQPFNNSGLSLPEEFANLPFDMPKLRSRKILSEQNQCASGSATSVDLGDLPFDMPKLKRRLNAQQPGYGTEIPTAKTESFDMSQASSSLSMRDDNKPGSFRQNLSLQINKTASLKLDPAGKSRGLHLNLFNARSAVDIDAELPLDRQGWYHGAITRIEAEATLRPLHEGCFLVRNCESARNDYSLSLKSAKGFMHMRMQQNDVGQFILGEFSQPFESVPHIIKHFCLNRLPVRGAEHMCLKEPVIAQIL